MGRMVRAASATVLLLLLAGCRSDRELDLLERERLSFKAENERIRARDLEEDWEKARRRSDTLSEQVLAVGRERDRLYARYDELRGDLARDRRDLAEAERQKGALNEQLGELRKRIGELEKELEEGRARLEKLEREAAEVRARAEAARAEPEGASATE